MTTQPLRAKRQAIFVVALFLLFAICLQAQVLQNKKPTKLLVQQYENYVAKGGLLTPGGWARASRFFAKSDPYPGSSDITVVSAPGIIGEDHVNGDHAEVATKWGDYYGAIDSSLRFKQDSIVTAEVFSLVFIRQIGPNQSAASDRSSGQWKLERTPQNRSAGVRATIQYVEQMRQRSNDPVVRRNALRTIHTLKHLTTGCGTPNPC
jgi:hypothetical protein